MKNIKNAVSIELTAFLKPYRFFVTQKIHLPLQQEEAESVYFLLVDFADPAFRGFDFAHLDACECFVKLLGVRTHFFHT